MSLPGHQVNRESAAVAPAAWSAGVLLAGVLALTALVYLPVLRYQFVYDDQGIIVENPQLRAWSYVPQYFTGQLWQHLFPNAPSNYYRPLNVVFWRLNHALFALRPMGWHAYALLLHLLATALVFGIVRRITDRPFVAAVAALLFGVHPSHHEVVAWVSATTESLCAVFYLAAFLAYLKSRERSAPVWMALSCLLYGLGLLSKETALVLPVLVFAHAALYGTRASDQPQPGPRARLARAILRASAYAPVCILYLAVRIHVLHGFSHAQSGMALSALLLTLPSVLFFYLKQWIFPVRFSEFYDVLLQTRFDLLHVGLPLVALAGAAAALWYFRRRLGPRDVAFALAAVAIPLLPAMNFAVFPSGELVHDRYSYLPSLGAALIAALALQPLCRGRLVFRMPQPLVLVLLAVVLPLAYSTANASSYWMNDSVLFVHANAVAPHNATARNNYAVQLAFQGDAGQAITILEGLVKEHPEYFRSAYNLGRLYYEAHLVGPAQHYLLQAQKIDPTSPEPDLLLGTMFLRAGRIDEAEARFRRALSLRPDDPKYHFALGVVLSQRPDCVSARAEFSRALVLDPAFTKAREQMDRCGVAAAAVAPPPVAVRPVNVPGTRP